MSEEQRQGWFEGDFRREAEGGEGTFSLKDAAFVLCSRWRSILAVTFLFLLGVGVAVFWLISPTYESKARIHIDLQSGSLPVLRAQGMYVSDAEKLAMFETIIQELKNQTMIQSVVEELDLGKVRVIGNIERLKNLYLDLRRWAGFRLGIKSWQRERDPAAASLAAVISDLAVNRLENSTILELTYQAKEPGETQRTLETVIRRFIDSRNQFTKEKASGSSLFLNQEIDRLRKEILVAEDEWLSLVKKDVYLMPADVFTTSSSPPSAQGPVSVSGLSVNEGVIEEMKIHVIKMQEELQAVLSRFPESDPQVRRLREMIRSYTQVINAAPLLQTRINRLKREVASKEGVYRELLTAQENALTMESQELRALSTVKVVQRPGLPGASVKPKRTLALGAGLLLGIFFGILFAFLMEFFDDTIKRPADAERRLGMRVISSLPRV